MHEPRSESSDPGAQRGELRLLRMRLRLSLLAVGIVPLVAATAFLYAVSPAQVPTELLTLFPALGLFLLPIVLWLPRHILHTTEALDKSRAEMRRLYETARADALSNGLTGLGNHRAFQEELDRQLECYNRYKVPVSLLLIDPR